MSPGFNSLQTGKPIQRSWMFRQLSNRWVKWFQFPSNGKAYPKLVTDVVLTLIALLVSIPFKRESLSKEKFKSIEFCIGFCFNSLQTGKPIQSMLVFRKVLMWTCVSIPFKRESLSKAQWMQKLRQFTSPLSFNSLQTGKPIQSNREFKATVDNDLFQFPSNGKAYPKSYGRSNNRIKRVRITRTRS